MIDCFGYKCLPLSEIPPVIRPFNPWPELPPETPEHICPFNWEGSFARVKLLYDAGKSAEEIADVLGIISVPAVCLKLRKWVKAGKLREREHPRQPGKWDAEKEAVMLKYLADGKSCVKAAVILGVSPETVRYHARRLGIDWREGKWICLAHDAA